MKAIIIAMLGLFLAACEVRFENQTEVKYESLECPSVETFISINQGETESQVSDKMKIKGVVNDYSKTGNFEFKTLKYECGSKIYSITFKNGFVDSKFML
mgnify:FL=1